MSLLLSDTSYIESWDIFTMGALYSMRVVYNYG